MPNASGRRQACRKRRLIWRGATMGRSTMRMPALRHQYCKALMAFSQWPYAIRNAHLPSGPMSRPTPTRLRSCRRPNTLPTRNWRRRGVCGSPAARPIMPTVKARRCGSLLPMRRRGPRICWWPVRAKPLDGRRLWRGRVPMRAILRKRRFGRPFEPVRRRRRHWRRCWNGSSSAILRRVKN